MAFNPRKMIRKIFLIGLMAFAIASAAAAGRKPKGGAAAETADMRKADYIFMEAKRLSLRGQNDAYFDLMDYARQLNPSDKLLGMELGAYYLRLDSVNGRRGLEMMRDYVANTPSDLYNAYSFAMICGHIGEYDEALRTWQLLHNRFPDRIALTETYAQALRSTMVHDNLRHSIELFDTLETSGGDPVQVATQRALAWMALGDTARVGREARMLIDKNPKSAPYQIFAGQIYQQILDSDSALTFFDRALELDPENGMAYYAKANFYNARNDSVNFDREVFNALQQADLDVDVKLAIMRDYVTKLYTDSLQQPRIATLFDVLHRQHPLNQDVADLHFRYLMSVGNLSAAAEQLEESLDLEPDNLKGWVTLASLYLNLKRYRESETVLRRALHYFSDEGDIWQLLVTVLTLDNQLDQALNDVEHAISITDTDNNELLSDLYTLKGDIIYKRGDLTSAMEAYDKAIELNRQNYMAMNNAAYFLACENTDLDRALELIEAAVKGRPDDSTTLDTYAWVFFKRGQYVQARDVIDLVLELDPESSSEVLEHAADIYEHLDQPERAAELRRAAEEAKKLEESSD